MLRVETDGDGRLARATSANPTAPRSWCWSTRTSRRPTSLSSPGIRAGRPRWSEGPGGPGAGEKPLTGDTADKVTKARKDKVSGGTVLRVETDLGRLTLRGARPQIRRHRGRCEGQQGPRASPAWRTSALPAGRRDLTRQSSHVLRERGPVVQTAGPHGCLHGEPSASCWLDPSTYVKTTVVVHSPFGGQTGGVRK